MRLHLMFRNAFLGLGLVLILATSGCGIFSPDPDPPDPPVPIPDADSPRNLMIRFREVYEQRKTAEYQQLFTTDFRFRFSAATDPELVSQYGDNWGVDEESDYADHLFNGFRDSLGTFQPAASRIDMQLDPFPIDDPVRTDSSAHYKTLIVPTLHLEIEVPTSPEATTYLIDGRYQFWMVRGDAAAVRSDQRADSLIWYIYRWEDQSTPAAPGTIQMASDRRTTWTWGRVKDEHK